MIDLPDKQDVLLTTSEVAEWLHVHRSYISDLRRTPGLAPRSFKFGRQLLTRRSELQNWLRAQEELHPHA